MKSSLMPGRNLHNLTDTTDLHLNGISGIETANTFLP
jgi:hypothetical protein